MKQSRIYLIVFFMAFILFTNSNTFAQDMSKKDTRPVKNVAVFLYNGVEILDFSGPVEVFEIAGLFRKDSKYQTHVYTFSLTGEPVLSQGCITVNPDYSINNCPEPDIVVLPGGSSGKVNNNKKFLSWLKELYKKDKTLMSVCTGAFMLSNAHLLDGKDATTWHGAIDRLRKKTPKAKIHTGVRFVDNGNIITTAGVSAGIDGALHLVSRMFGKGAAEETAKYMEYDKWVPGDGLVMNKTAQK